MKRRDALKTIGTIAGTVAGSRLLPACAEEESVGSLEQAVGPYPANFELLHSDASWRKTWTHIIPGKFSSSPYSGLLFFEQSTGYAEVYNTDGQGRIVAPALRTYSPLGGRITWTHVIPGLFGSSGLTGILLYDKPAGFARFFACTGGGNFVQRREYAGWRDTWTHIVPGMFTTSIYSGLLFYSPTEGYGELWNTNGTGLAGTAPVQTFTDWRSTWTHIVAADFFWTPGYISSKPILSDVFFYEGSTGWGEMYRFDETGLVPFPTASRTLLASATGVVAGNFGGFGNSDLLLHDRSAGELRIYSFNDLTETSSEIVDRERLTNLRTTIDLVVAGNLYMANPDDHWFNDGPSRFFSRYDRNWRAGTGAFSDLLLYDRAAGLGETYLHEPLPPPAEPLDAYITAQSSHGGAPPVSSGSVLPGETISFHVSSALPYTIKIYGQGYFAGGQTERLMTQIGGQWPATTPLAIGRSAYKDGAQWPVAAGFVVPGYPSGLYLARVQDTSSPPRTVDVPFVVRGASASQTKVLLVIADATYEAYNDWGGRNVYGHATVRETTTGPVRAFVGAFPSASASRVPYAFEVSFARPFANGLGNTPKWQKWEVPLVRWLARQGIPVDVCTSRDLHFQPPTTPNYRLLLFVGHHEYWSKEMRDNVESFARAGGGVGFFSGNVCWWQVRVSPDGNKLSCYKVAGFDPILGTDPSLTTVNWWDLPGTPRPETALTGVSWYDSLVVPEHDPQFQFTVTKSGHWAFQGTGLQNGNGFGVYSGGSVVGSELDRIQNPGPNGMRSPANYTIARVLDPRPGQNNFELGTMGSFIPAGGTGEVFNAATMNWTFGLADASASNKVPRITLNVIDRLGPTFRKVSGLANDIGVGANGTVWIVSNTPVNGGFSTMKRVGSSWSTISGGAVRIAVDPTGNPWVVNSVNSIFKLVNGAWQTMPGTATDIGIGANGSVWIVGTPTAGGGRPIFRWNGSGWTQIAGAAVRIAVDPNGNAWVVNSAGSIFEWVGTGWRNRPGLATDIGVGPDGTVWVVGIVGAPGGGGNAIFRWSGADWRHVPGGATSLSVGPGGNPWMVSAIHEIFVWS